MDEVGNIVLKHVLSKPQNFIYAAYVRMATYETYVKLTYATYVI